MNQRQTQRTQPLNQYNQQVNTQQYTQPTEQQYYIPPQKKNNILIAGFMIAVLIGAVGVYFLMKPRLDNLTNPELQSPTNVFEMSELKICNSVDANFICDENKEKIIKRGDEFYIYAQVTQNNIDGSKKTSWQEGMKITDNSGIVVYNNDNFGTLTPNLRYNGLNLVPLKILMDTKDDNIGKTITHLTLLDLTTNQKITKIIEYKLI